MSVGSNLGQEISSFLGYKLGYKIKSKDHQIIQISTMFWQKFLNVNAGTLITYTVC